MGSPVRTVAEMIFNSIGNGCSGMVSKQNFSLPTLLPGRIVVPEIRIGHDQSLYVAVIRHITPHVVCLPSVFVCYTSQLSAAQRRTALDRIKRIKWLDVYDSVLVPRQSFFDADRKSVV